MYSEVVVGRKTQKVYKITVASRDNQTAQTIKEMMKLQIKPAKIKVVIEYIKTLRDGREQIETGGIKEAETLQNNITDNLGDKIETHIQRPHKTKTENNQHTGGNLHSQHRGHPNSTESRDRCRKRGNYSQIHI